MINGRMTEASEKRRTPPPGHAAFFLPSKPVNDAMTKAAAVDQLQVENRELRGLQERMRRKERRASDLKKKNAELGEQHTALLEDYEACQEQASLGLSWLSGRKAQAAKQKILFRNGFCFGLSFSVSSLGVKVIFTVHACMYMQQITHGDKFFVSYRFLFFLLVFRFLFLRQELR